MALSDTPVADKALPAAPAAGPERWEVVTGRHYVDRVVMTTGGMGRIVTALDQRLGRRVALKELRTDSPDLRVRFEREVLLTAQLQHPSIVRVHEAGRWATGEPFYAMELVRGVSLDRLVAAAPGFEERLAITPHVLAVADALAYAHGQRIIHRDLKPHNVMVGDFGETVVIDWGLGKHLGEDGPGAEPAAKHWAEAAETAFGDVLGTPAYMPPEQAAGEPVDERADVYAIGAILYHVLAGAPPYAARTVRELVEAVRAGPPRPLAERQPGVPPDLLAVVERAMARDSEDRYPTARELAEDLRRFQAGQLVGAHRYSLSQLVARWLRRHRAPLAVAAAAAVVLLVLGALALTRIVEERRVALEHRAEAEDLMDFMLFDLRDRLRPIGRLELLDEVATKAGEYHARRPAGESDGDDRRRAVALATIAEVRQAQGNTAAALAHLRGALEIRDGLAARAPDDLERQRELLVARRRVADALRAVGDAAAAVAEYQTALAVAERLATRDPDRLDWRREVAVLHASIGEVLRVRGEASAALEAHRAAVAAFQELAAAAPDEPRPQHDLSTAKSQLAAALQMKGRGTEALAAYRAALAIRQDLGARYPDDPSWQRLLAMSHRQVGDLLVTRGDLRGALAEYRASQAIGRQLVAWDPENASWRRELAVAHQRLAEVHQRLGEVEAAHVEQRAALDLWKRLREQNPGNLQWQQDLVGAHQAMARLLLPGKDLTAILAEYRAARALVEELAVKDPGNAHWQRELAVIRFRIGEALQTQEQLEEALGEYRTGAAIARELSARDPGSATARRILADGHERVGALLDLQRDTAGALREHRAARAIREELVARDPMNTVWQIDLARAHTKLGEALARSGEHEEALSAYRAGVELLEPLVKGEHDSPGAARSLSLALMRTGDAMKERGDPAAADSYRSALAIAEERAGREPTNPFWPGLADTIRHKLEGQRGPDARNTRARTRARSSSRSE